MQFQYILYSISLLAKKQRGTLYETAKKIGHLSLTALFTNSVSAIEAGDIKNVTSIQSPSGYRQFVQIETNYARYSNFATAPASRTFDYDPGLLPEVAEVIFVLRIKHANIGKPFVINLSGNYLLKFTKDRIYLLDTYTKSRDVYEYQTANPNITIGLGVSKGLPRNYKSIVIKEDAHGKLYDYAALRSDNISTDETMLSETLSHPFYQIAGQDGVEDQVKVTKAMTFYRNVPSHSRHARCVKESMGILKQIQEILGSGSLVCGPEAGSGILSANHQPVEEMKLDQPLVEAAVKRKYNDTVGYHLLVRLDLKNPLAFLASSYFCKASILTLIESRRKKRAPGIEDCMTWPSRLVSLFLALNFNIENVHQIVHHVLSGGATGGTEAHREFDQLVYSHSNSALRVLLTALAIEDEASTSSHEPAPLENVGAQGGLHNTVAGAKLEVYRLFQEEFEPLPNEVSRVDSSGEVKVVDGEQYTTETIPVTKDNIRRIRRNNDHYLSAITFWIEQIKERIERANAEHMEELTQSLGIAYAIQNYLSQINSGSDTAINLVVSTVSHNDVLIGISVGQIIGNVYQEEFALLSPGSLLGEEGAYIGAVAYLRSEALRYLFSRHLVNIAETNSLSVTSTGSVARLGFRQTKNKKDEL